MSDIVIRTENLSKRYRVRPQERYKALRDTLTGAIYFPFRKMRDLFIRNRTDRGISSDQGAGNIWAVKDVSFEIKMGEVVGIIGSNGAGKTTLLKILAGITEPTGGYAEVRGRVGSLLEVGTGFHPELTGRENVLLNGAILGMKKKEIERKFDEMVDFAGVEKFIDTPVKYYSTGMQVRLAFSVAAHLDPEILLVDEVLAVGDVGFQKKCLGRMEAVAQGGRTVLFVSHNMQAVSMLCQRAILLKEGEIELEGPATKVVSQYLASGSKQLAEVTYSYEESPGAIVKLHTVRALNADKEVVYDMNIGDPITLQVEFWCSERVRVLTSLHLLNEQGMLLFTTTNLEVLSKPEYEPGLHRCECTVPANLLQDGLYNITLYLSDWPYRNHLYRPEIISFRVHEDGSGRGDFVGEWSGLIRPMLPWTGQQVGGLQ